MNDPSQTREPARQRADSPDGGRDTGAPRVGVVVIGRHEGERLERSLRSVGTGSGLVLYVDSGSTDDSVELARRRTDEVTARDDSVPFTAARARNAGLKRLLELDASVELVQFLDGDCELEAGWLERARR